MHKHYSFQLPSASHEQAREKTPQLLNELVAQQSLFQISKNEDSPRNNDTFWKEITRLSLCKRYEKTSASLPKKKPVELMPVIEIKSHRTSNYDLDVQILNTTNYMIMGDLRERRGRKRTEKADKTLLQDTINRKAKYLFRSRNKAKLPALPANSDIFSSSFYCGKLQINH